MQTQGIILSVADGVKTSSGKKADAKQVSESNDFGKIMESHSKTGEPQTDIPKSEKPEQPISEAVSETKEIVISDVSLPTTEESKILDLSEAEEAVMDFLKDVFGMSEEDLLDIMEQMGIVPLDFICTLDDLTGQYQFTGTNELKDFVMEVYGITEESAFLTDDVLSDKLNTLVGGMKNLAKDFMQKTLPVSEEELATLLEKAVLEPVVSEDGQENDTSQPDMILSEAEEETVVEISLEQPVNDGDAPTKQSLEFSHETAKPEKGMSDKTEHSANLMADSFVRHLSEAFEEAEPEAVRPTDTMQNIVEQIVKHIRIRVLPQSSSMELMLHPASLGRVLLHVSNANGVSTATLTVQNEVAKEAIENQLITLQQTFEEKGLKVTEVEVNVSEFGFHKEDDGTGENHSGQNGKKNKSRRFHFVADEPVTNQEDTPISQDSLIDYTA